MSQHPYPPAVPTGVAAATPDVRRRFVLRTYSYLTAAILAFVAIEVWLFSSGAILPLAEALLASNWLLVLGGFVIVSYLGSMAAHRVRSKGVQLLALGAVVLAEAVIFAPMLLIADVYAPGVIGSAALITLLGFVGLTGIAVTTAADFSKLGAILRWAFVVALIAIVGAVLFGFELGTWFSVAMIGLAGGAILFETDAVLHRYPADREVGAALELFTSVALMFWYVLRLLLGSRR